MKVYQLSRIDVYDADKPSGWHTILCKYTMKIKGPSPDGTMLELKIRPEGVPPHPPVLKWPQMFALWLIAESNFHPTSRSKALPGWWLSKTLEMKHSQFSRDVIKPLEGRHWICFEKRNTTNPESTHRNAKEKCYHLERMNMREIFFVLLDSFQSRYLKNLANWEGTELVPYEEWSTISKISEHRFITLAYLQKELDRYEASPQWYIDRGANPPPGLV